MEFYLAWSTGLTLAVAGLAFGWAWAAPRQPRRLRLAVLWFCASLAVRATLEAPVLPPPGATADEWNDQRCDAASSLLERWGPASRVVRARSEAGAWRTWNAGETAAVRAVGARSAALRGVVHDACARVRATRRAANYR